MSDSSQAEGREQLAADPSTILQGFDSFSAAARSTAVQGNVRTVGARTTVAYYTCKSTEQLATNLRVSGEVNASFLFGSGDAKSKYVQSLNITETSVVVAVYADVVTGSAQATDVSWAPKTVPPTAATLNDFYQGYGDSYVSTLTTGAEYIATYVLYSQSTEQQQEIVASLTASGIGESGTVSGSLETAVSQAASSSKVETAFNQTLIGITGLPLPSQDDLAAFALSFDTRTPDAPEIISFETTGYEHVPGSTSGVFDPILASRELLLGDTTGTGLVGAADVVSQLDNQIARIQEVYACYGYTGDAKLAQRAGQVADDRQALGSVLAELRKDPTRTPLLPTLPSLRYGTPAVDVAVTVGGEFGTPGNQPFQDLDYLAVLQRTQLTALSFGEYTPANLPVALWDSLTAVYLTPDGSPRTVAHGEGAPSPTWQLQPGEFVSGYTYTLTSDGGLLGQLTLTTQRGGVQLQTLTWPQALPSAAPSDSALGYTVPAGSVAVGFAGTLATDQSPVAIGTFGLQLATFTPARWQQRTA
ncbi:hypothetical protein [Streptacidiphilus sp. P02-A3a]|uniref:hypothetical protein n=1 Tax=Streptacidiphilus sp. P02-A3a TaxID=2704468 RepID=UPI0015FC083A|nr:hypothetical protein [Streptacidiphilus sp. P02-A3a]QMU71466.1 hypothetical protein GXP74_27755 [Streptacidiphilus sp. P02-A3a]